MFQLKLTLMRVKLSWEQSESSVSDGLLDHRTDVNFKGGRMKHLRGVSDHLFNRPTTRAEQVSLDQGPNTPEPSVWASPDGPAQ